MNKEALLKRRAELIRAREQMLNNAAVADGAIQDTNYWLSVLDAEEKADAEAKAKSAATEAPQADEAAPKTTKPEKVN